MQSLPLGASPRLRLSLLLLVACVATGWAAAAAAACPTPDVDTCLIDGECRDQGDANPAQACEVCDPSRSADGWSPRAFGDPCDDANACTSNDQCDGAGGCAGAPIVSPGCDTLPRGARCAQGSECQSGACVDGFCCNATCAAGCMGCSRALTGQTDGTCAPVTEGTNPHGNCVDERASSCGRDGVCNGQGQCRKYAPQTPCAAAACVEGTNGFLGAGLCSTQGVCERAAPTSCGLYLCQSGACTTSCASDRDCVTGARCDRAAGRCEGTNRPPLANAGPPKTATILTRVSLDGSASTDPDLDPLTYQWRQVDGEPRALDNAASAVATWITPQVVAETSFTFELTVSDAEASATATTTVLVRPPIDNVQPVAEISAPAVVKPGAAVLVGGTRSRDPEGAPLSYTWTVTGAASRITGDASPLLSFTVPADAPEGAVTITLVVSDGILSSEAATATIQVQPDASDDDCGCATIQATPRAPRFTSYALLLGLIACAWASRRRRGQGTL